MRVQGDCWHQIAHVLRANPMEMWESVLGITYANLLDPAPVPEQRHSRYEPSMGILGDGLFAYLLMKCRQYKTTWAVEERDGA
jgi:hypothetical protein